jgi:hypothetical protein
VSTNRNFATAISIWTCAPVARAQAATATALQTLSLHRLAPRLRSYSVILREQGTFRAAFGAVPREPKDLLFQPLRSTAIGLLHFVHARHSERARTTIAIVIPSEGGPRALSSARETRVEESLHFCLWSPLADIPLVDT